MADGSNIIQALSANNSTTRFNVWRFLKVTF